MLQTAYQIQCTHMQRFLPSLSLIMATFKSRSNAACLHFSDVIALLICSRLCTITVTLSDLEYFNSDFNGHNTKFARQLPTLTLAVTIFFAEGRRLLVIPQIQTCNGCCYWTGTCKMVPGYLVTVSAQKIATSRRRLIVNMAMCPMTVTAMDSSCSNNAAL